MILYIKLAWRNVWRSKKRTWITASSIAFSVFFACLMQSSQLGSYDNMINNSARFFTGHVGIHQIDFWENQIVDNSFNQKELTQVNLSNSSILMGVPRLNSFALASHGQKTKGAALFGVSLEAEDAFSYLSKKLIRGNYNKTGGVLIAEGLAANLNLTVGDTLVLMGQGYHGVNSAGKYSVKGILRFPIPNLNQGAIYLPLNILQEFLSAPNMISSYSILLEDSQDTKDMKAHMESVLKGKELGVMTWQEMLPELVSSIELDYFGGWVVLIILYIVIGLGIFGTFLMMIKERTYELGILNAIGMTKQRVQIMVAIEIFLLIFLGVLMGLLIATPIVLYFWSNPILLSGDAALAMEKFGYEPIIPFALNLKIFYNQGISIFVIALLLAIYPMLAIKKLKIIKALKE